MPCLPTKGALTKFVKEAVEKDTGEVTESDFGGESARIVSRDIENCMERALKKCDWKTMPDGTHVKCVDPACI